ncbi:MAG: hypothetical protein WCF67_00755, partial [Chitinophagaceae bacterium]
LRVINKGIKIFIDHNTRQQKQQMSDAKNKKKIAALSKALMEKSGLKDKKGNDTYMPEPINKWTKRKTVVEQRLRLS